MISRPQPENTDADLRQMLRACDPAGQQSPAEWALLEMRITAQILRQPQKRRIDVMDSLGLFPAPQILNWQIPWPVVAAGTMVCGLALGLAIAMITEPQSQAYTVTTALAEPWPGLVE